MLQANLALLTKNVVRGAAVLNGQSLAGALNGFCAKINFNSEWSTRLLAFLAVPLLIDHLLSPAMSWSIWPLWLMDALGTGPGRVTA